MKKGRVNHFVVRPRRAARCDHKKVQNEQGIRISSNDATQGLHSLQKASEQDSRAQEKSETTE